MHRLLSRCRHLGLGCLVPQVLQNLLPRILLEENPQELPSFLLLGAARAVPLVLAVGEHRRLALVCHQSRDVPPLQGDQGLPGRGLRHPYGALAPVHSGRGVREGRQLGTEAARDAGGTPHPLGCVRRGRGEASLPRGGGLLLLALGPAHALDEVVDRDDPVEGGSGEPSRHGRAPLHVEVPVVPGRHLAEDLAGVRVPAQGPVVLAGGEQQGRVPRVAPREGQDALRVAGELAQGRDRVAEVPDLDRGVAVVVRRDHELGGHVGMPLDRRAPTRTAAAVGVGEGNHLPLTLQVPNHRVAVRRRRSQDVLDLVVPREVDDLSHVARGLLECWKERWLLGVR
mmetsp:Transcript_11252/g.28468  ORF Transcript_11252/g.28468 Transcript_11252/m.28468 type:complete len:341 (+) Transcript_11252:457-1479(+)